MDEVAGTLLAKDGQRSRNPKQDALDVDVNHRRRPWDADRRSEPIPGRLEGVSANAGEHGELGTVWCRKGLDRLA